MKELYDRYKLTGKFFKQNSYLDQYGTTGSGASLAKYVLKRIFQEKRFLLLFRYPFDMATRLIEAGGYKRDNEILAKQIQELLEHNKELSSRIEQLESQTTKKFWKRFWSR